MREVHWLLLLGQLLLRPGLATAVCPLHAFATAQRQAPTSAIKKYRYCDHGRSVSEYPFSPSSLKQCRARTVDGCETRSDDSRVLHRASVLDLDGGCAPSGGPVKRACATRAGGWRGSDEPGADWLDAGIFQLVAQCDAGAHRWAATRCNSMRRPEPRSYICLNGNGRRWPRNAKTFWGRRGLRRCRYHRPVSITSLPAVMARRIRGGWVISQ